ncbi:MAG TPA: YggT family protein [Anaerolineae bacterium]|nr:YggT family protein [Anaerolineae bacterium]
MFTIRRILALLFDLYTLAILLQVLGSWLLVAQVRLPLWVHGILQFIDQITAPLLRPIRRILPAMAGLDLSPIVALLLLQVLEWLVMSLLRI